MYQDTSDSNACASVRIDTSCIYVEILEEPKSDGTRFRYAKEGKSAGIIRGANYSEKHKTYPTIKIHDYRGKACVIISLVTVDGPPHYPHPHKLIGKACTHGVYYKDINNSEEPVSFLDLGIQCVKRNDAQESLAEREALQVDPFGTGFQHARNLKTINFNAVRLCFQVYLPDSNGELCLPIKPVTSTPIFDNKVVSDLSITKLSHCSAPVTGNQEIILLCGSVNKDDIEIVFYEEKDGERIWSANGKFSKGDVHRKTAIVFETPAYINHNVENEVHCFVCLRRPSDGTESSPWEFTLFPRRNGAANHLNPVFESGSEFSLPAFTSVPGSGIYSEDSHLPLSQNSVSTPHAASTVILPNTYQAVGALNNHTFSAFSPMTERNIPGNSLLPQENIDNGMIRLNNLEPLMPACQNVIDVLSSDQNIKDKFPPVSEQIALHNEDSSGNSAVDSTVEMLSSLSVNTNDAEITSENASVPQDDTLQNISGWNLNINSSELMQYSY